MIRLQTISLVILCLCIKASIVHSVASVVPLAYHNFEDITQIANGTTHEDWFVMFHAPWCKHCKKTMPVFQKASSHLFKRKNFATVNIDKSPRLAERFSIKDLPTLIMFSKSKLYLYRSKHREVTDLVKFADGGFQFQRSIPIPKDFTFIQVMVKRVYKDVILTLYRMYVKAPLPTFLNLFLGMILGAFCMFLIMKGAMMQQLDDILEEQERRKLRHKLRKAKRKKNE
jgi:thiol-disulfide isomerase/thioredoxin